MLTLFTDLDGTLIYSSELLRGQDVVVVEELHNGHKTCMLKSTWDRLERLQKLPSVSVVYVTSRTDEQYHRLRLPKVQCALINNGGTLLVDGEEDIAWSRESADLVDSCVNKMQRCYDYLRREFTHTSLHFSRELFLCGSFKDPDMVVRYLQSTLSPAKFAAHVVGRKIYVVPKRLDKGQALCRYRDMFEAGLCIAAGDSALDLAMDVYSDLFVTTYEYSKSGVLKVDGPVFADRLLDIVEERI